MSLRIPSGIGEVYVPFDVNGQTDYTLAEITPASS